MEKESADSQQKLLNSLLKKEAVLEESINKKSIDMENFYASLNAEKISDDLREALETGRNQISVELNSAQADLEETRLKISNLKNEIISSQTALQNIEIAAESNKIQRDSARIAIIAAVASWIGAGVTLWPVLKRAVTGN